MIVIQYAFLDFILGLSDISTVLLRIDPHIIATKLHYLVKILFIPKFQNVFIIFTK